MTKFVFLGRLDKIKGIRRLLEAWRFMRPYEHELQVFGQGDESDWCARYIKEYDLAHINMMGFLKHDEVPKVLKSADALIMPTQCFEGFPMTILEAMSVGTPVIGSNIGNVKSIIQETHAGELFQYDDPSKLARCIQKFNPQKFSADKIMSTFNRLYSPEVNYQQLTSIYLQACNGGVESV